MQQGMSGEGRAFRDVRMTGFASRTTVEAVWNWLAEVVREYEPWESEAVELFAAAGRVLADDVVSPRNVPDFPKAMMDGYAVRAEETHGTGVYQRVSLQVVGTCYPGRAYEGTVGPGQAVQIMTGGRLPKGADAVVPVEATERLGEMVWISDAVVAGRHVSTPGEDVSAGSVVFSAGRRLRPQDLGMLSILGQRVVRVRRRPRVKVVITGNEVLPAGSASQVNMTPDANGPMLCALITRDGGQPLLVGPLRDEPAALTGAVSPDDDVIIITGGSSVGQEDFVPRWLAEHGELVIHGVAMRPSSPTGMGRWQGKLVFLLPGNPVSCLCAYDTFAGRVVRWLAQRTWGWPYHCQRGRLTQHLHSQVGRWDYARVKMQAGAVEPLAISGASLLSTTTQADGFVIIPADSEGYPAGREVEVYLYDS
ncbi:MAG: molybdopterin molybdenumtransferase MoeA [Planctomycetaceae bacterium]|nr:MAG: molybdopterin molybdenumtransferase MoeA [Planctomycetaceae bacterium]